MKILAVVGSVIVAGLIGLGARWVLENVVLKTSTSSKSNRKTTKEH